MLKGMKAYSLDLRQKILRACDQRLGSHRAIAALFGVSQSFIEKLLRRHRTTGSIAPRPHAGGRRALVRRLIQESPDATLAECCERLLVRRGLRVSVPTMGRLVTALGLPRKKSRSTPANEIPNASSRLGRPTKRQSRRSPPSASNSSMNRASTSR